MAASESAGFNDWIDARITALLQLGERDFGSLVCRLPGIYPGEVVASLDRLAVGDAAIKAPSQRLIASSRVDRANGPWESVGLGLFHSHPLDYEWRFLRETVELLADRCNHVAGPSNHVALVATPTVAMTRAAIFDTRPVTYIGADTALTARVTLPAHISATRQIDLLERHASTRRYAVVIMDPPWYDEYLQRFLWFAASSMRRGGTLLLAMPPVGTRPGIEEEHVRHRDWCAKLGFQLEQVEEGVLPYETPLFERNALRAAGILNVPPDWRRGDLWVLRKVGSNRAKWPGDLDRTGWSEHRFGQVRLRVDRRAVGEGGAPTLVPLVPGDVLPTVSRRDTRRAAARVWTTGNRIFGCSAPDELGRILDDWQTGSRTATSNSSIKQAVMAQVGAILEIEGNEVDCSNKKRAGVAAQGGTSRG